MAESSLKDEWISIARLKPYLNATYEDRVLAIELYKIDRKLSATLFHEIAYIEVALRNAITTYLSTAYGEDWCTGTRVVFDKRVRDNIIESWNLLPTRYTRETPRNNTLVGRLAAESMFRTWTNMLDEGGGTGLPAPFDKADHDTIWTSESLSEISKGARPLAQKTRDASYQTNGITREWGYNKISPLRHIRNRIAHHESIAPKGVPIPGADQRLNPQECQEACMNVAMMLDRDLAKDLETIGVPDILDELDNFMDKFMR